MQTRLETQSWAAKTRRAFSLVELLTAVSITVVIIFALYAMFNQTQKALRANVTQVDVLESGRAAMEMMCRELEQMSASEIGGATNVFVQKTPSPLLSSTILLKDLDGNRNLRLSFLQEIFFLRRITNNWQGIAYVVGGANNGVGTLYRYETSTNYRRFTYYNLTSNYFRLNINSTNLVRVMDGVVHLQFTAYDSNGRPIVEYTPNGGLYRITTNYNAIRNPAVRPQPFWTNNLILVDQLAATKPVTKFAFLSNALPASIEVELGVLEPATYKQFQAMQAGPASVAQSYLSKQAGKVHLFRQRIPIRTVLQ